MNQNTDLNLQECSSNMNQLKSPDFAISLEHVSKKYCKNISKSMLYGITDTIRNSLCMSSKPDLLRDKEFWAVKNVSTEIKKGETVGLVGPNGSGKTTILKMINGIFWPDKGKIIISGRIGALIQVGAGFHPMLSGRENVYINGAILGMSKQEIDNKFEDILNFADIGEFIDSPVKYYSSGMFVRLGFSIAIHAEPEILLIDEILAVGDQLFQNKCKRKLSEYRNNNKTVVIISHNDDMINMLCDRIIVMKDGENIYTGNTSNGLILYKELIEQTQLSKEEKLRHHDIKKNNIDFADCVKLNKTTILNNMDQECNEFQIGNDITVCYEFTLNKKIKNARFSAAIGDENIRGIIWHTNQDKRILYNNLKPGNYKLKVTFEKPQLIPKIYQVNFGLYDAETSEVLYKSFSTLANFLVKGNQDIARGTILCDSKWELENTNL